MTKVPWMVLAICAAFLDPTTAVSWDDGGGGGDGCCGGAALEELLREQSAEERELSNEIIDHLRTLTVEEFIILRAADDRVCSHMNCRGLDAGIVKQLVILFDQQKQRDYERELQRQANRISAILAAFIAASTLVTIGSFVLAFAAYRRSLRNDAELRSVESDLKLSADRDNVPGATLEQRI